MTKSELVAGLLVTFVTLALGGWSSILVAARYKHEGPLNSRHYEETSGQRTGSCTTADGRKFEWSFSNVPFGAVSCSRD
jgi:hypothetical protein